MSPFQFQVVTVRNVGEVQKGSEYFCEGTVQIKGWYLSALFKRHGLYTIYKGTTWGSVISLVLFDE